MITYKLLAKLKARYDLSREASLGDIIKRKYKQQREIRGKLFRLYKFIPEKHQALFSPHSITRNLGCGCELCTKLHEYAKAKLHLHYLKKTFNADFGMDTLLVHGEYKVPISANFYALYSEHQVNNPDDFKSELKFFNEIYEERRKKVKELRRNYKVIKESISHILSESNSVW